ncbi:SRPBCC family protein [Ornithinimicrobium tianjinense]|uniref:Activator of HSP90 ATPase n=1 Tax=Ornithinimicrobium tianjinense TaxID=1195761 RepID=A0A917BR46_9MICO|nr:SRPBCC domain-containing protein [Ornithinimicrobium tianjinense]GGF53337.1 activator of HSP90 ATPase [Ornithinimicrobium tianjinense]
MPVTDITKDLDNRMLTITADFAAPVDRVWELYADPRQLEKVWGPPSHPATFDAHELTVGSTTKYYMTGPEGEKYYGTWQLTDVDAPRSFAFEDRFADADYAPAEGMPVSYNTYAFEPTESGTRAVFTTTYDTAEALQQVLDMGVEEGATSAINQIDDFLAA